MVNTKLYENRLIVNNRFREKQWVLLIEAAIMTNNVHKSINIYSTITILALIIYIANNVQIGFVLTMSRRAREGFSPEDLR